MPFGIPGYKHGGVVKRTGMAMLHAGEKVVTNKEDNNYKGVSAAELNGDRKNDEKFVLKTPVKKSSSKRMSK